MVTTFGWHTRARMRPSSIIGRRYFPAVTLPAVAARSLRATSQSSRVSQARYTSPKAPRPISSRVRRCPQCVNDSGEPRGLGRPLSAVETLESTRCACTASVKSTLSSASRGPARPRQRPTRQLCIQSMGVPSSAAPARSETASSFPRTLHFLREPGQRPLRASCGPHPATACRAPRPVPGSCSPSPAAR